MPERWQHELRKLKTLEPPPGLWDRAVLGPGREPPRRRTWRVIAPIAAALAVVVVAGTLGLVRAFSPAPGSPDWVANHRAGRLTDPGFGWSIRVPAGLGARHFRRGDGRVTSDGVRVTSFPPDLGAPGSSTPPMGWLRSFPADGVAVQIWSLEGGPPGPPPLRDSAFPLARSYFSRTRPYVGGTPPGPWCGRCASRHCEKARSGTAPTTCSAGLRDTRPDLSRPSQPRPCRAAIRSRSTSARA